MIIGEKNLIIGLIDTIISEKSKSIFFYIVEQFNYIIQDFNSFIFKITPVSTAPPKFF
jgi:hypothetical protein